MTLALLVVLAAADTGFEVPVTVCVPATPGTTECPVLTREEAEAVEPSECGYRGTGFGDGVLANDTCCYDLNQRWNCGDSTDTDGDGVPNDEKKGCGCAHAAGEGSLLGGGLLALAWMARRRRSTRSPAARGSAPR